MVTDLSLTRQRSQSALPLLWADVFSGPSTSIPAAGHFLWRSEVWGGQLPYVACSRGAEMGVFPSCFPDGATPTLGSPGWWGWGGTNPLGAAVKTALPLLPARCFEVGPRAWLCRAAPRPVIRHVRSRLHLLITARSAGTLASPQTTFPSPQGRESLPQPCPQGCGPGAWVAGGTAHPVYKGLLGAGGLLGPCVLPGHCLPTTACLSQQDLS